MPLDVIMPALGMAQETGQIVAWHKQPGDAVAKGDVLFEVETDKATMEVEAQGDGYLTDVSAKEGTDVPVGNTIARISDSAESSAPPEPSVEATPDTSDDLPEGKNVIMPTLGMAQDTGLLVVWHKSAGDAVDSDDILFEVETDKSTVEVSAGTGGFLAAVLAAEGEEVPVGQTIAIISAEAPAHPVTRKATETPAPAKPTAEVKAEPKDTAPTAPKAAPPASETGRILVSPKARRLARAQGLDLARLVEAGYPQPYHVKDLEALKSLPAAASSQRSDMQSTSRVTASVPVEGFTEFAAWAAENGGLTDTAALLAGLCGTSLGTQMTIAVDTFGATRTFATSAHLGDTRPTEDTAQLRLRDLRSTAITSVMVGNADVPVITLCRVGDGLTITLEYAPDQMGANDAIALLSNFAGRMEQPLRHLF